MANRKKVLVALLISLTIIFFSAYIVASEYAKNAGEALVYPEGGLSNSLFVAQNTNYIQNNALTQKYALSSIPYTLDVPEGACAYVGNGCVIQAAESLYVYITCHNADVDAERAMLGEFPQSLMIDYDPAYTYTQQLASQSGYTNGFSVDYFFDMLSVSNGSVAKNGYAAAYDIKDPCGDGRGDILICVVTTETGNVAFASAKSVLDAIILTVQYDQKMDKQMSRQETGMIEEEQEETGRPETGQGGGSYDFASLVDDGDVDARFIPFSIDHPYADMFVNCRYDKPVDGSVMTLYGPDKRKIGDIVLSADGLTTQFQVGSVTEDMLGVYVVKVTYYDRYSGLSLEVGDAADAQEAYDGERDLDGQDENAGNILLRQE